MDQPDEPCSPCVRMCCLDDDAVCLGCGRHVDEITGWQQADADARRRILERARLRRDERASIRPPPQPPGTRR